uniref:Acylamino-acid-releasing enzyme N-terminal domain-containing protein n=1 Tax=Rhodosorus marinus TaxID=101924 RepID=A0A7S2ZMF8_9RHOD|mmetsp:Transcript_2486/g.10817  ORF Transcript_2486/g.10817 Transcript_2486/m.10817 type:complete len:395 (+) Transcript_2486:2562-3746(+)
MGVSNLGVSFAMASGPGNEKKSPDVTRIGDEYQQLLHRAVDCSTIQLRRNEDGRIVSTSLWTQRDALLGKVRKFVKQSVIELPTTGDANLVAQFPPVETSYVAEYVQQDAPKPRTVRFFENHLEIWNESFLEKVVKTREVHGDVFFDEIFGCHAFIGDELLYSAAPAKSKPSNNASSGAAVIDNGTLDEYQKVEDLGEKYPKKASPRLYVLNLSDGRLSRLGGNTPDKDVKDVQYNAAAQLLCFVFREPFGDESPMGMFYSFNRPSVLYVLPRKDFADGKLNADPIPVTSTTGCDYNVLCARFSPNGDRLVFVSSPATLAHNMSMSLRSLELGSGITSVRASTILDIPRNPTEDEYPGLYLYFRRALIDRFGARRCQAALGNFFRSRRRRAKVF